MVKFGTLYSKAGRGEKGKLVKEFMQETGVTENTARIVLAKYVRNMNENNTN